MPYSQKLPSVMCMSCKYMDYRPNYSPAYHCTDDGNFTNGDKCKCDPNKDGTAAECKRFCPK